MRSYYYCIPVALRISKAHTVTTMTYMYIGIPCRSNFFPFSVPPEFRVGGL